MALSKHNIKPIFSQWIRVQITLSLANNNNNNDNYNYKNNIHGGVNKYFELVFKNNKPLQML